MHHSETPAAGAPRRRSRSWSHRPGRWLRRAAVAVVALLLVGCAYETAAGALAARRYPPPGERIDVGGHRLHIACAGSGEPTVILASGSGVPSPNWSRVQAALADVTRVCAYDRAGYGWSDPASTPRTGDQVVQELHTLLQKAGIDGPLVLVGHSLGGLYTRLYAARHPEQVQGMVLVDARHEDATAALAQVGVQEMSPAAQRLSYYLNRLGVLRALAQLTDPTSLPGLGHMAKLPADVQPVYLSLLLRPQRSLAVAAEARAIPGLEAAVRVAGDLGDRPLVVVSAGGPPAGFPAAAYPVLQELQAELAGLSTRGRQVVASDSGHYVHLDRPELVGNAIRDVVAAVRQQEAAPGNQ